MNFDCYKNERTPIGLYTSHWRTSCEINEDEINLKTLANTIKRMKFDRRANTLTFTDRTAILRRIVSHQVFQCSESNLSPEEVTESSGY
jgi:hypothetical protein